jgi:IS605 OrfB family transposase
MPAGCPSRFCTRSNERRLSRTPLPAIGGRLLFSRRIVEFALAHGASIIVFEHLGKFKPERGKCSRYSNSKRSYWLRGRIFRYSRYKAWELGILTCRINPRDTSRLCGNRLPVVRQPGQRRPQRHSESATSSLPITSKALIQKSLKLARQCRAGP